MAIKMDKMRKSYESHQKGGDFWTPPEGDTLVYIHPQCRQDDEYEPTDGVNYIPVSVHYGVGANNAMVVSLDSSANPIVEHPFVKAFLKKRKIKLTGKCPLAKAMDDGEMTEDEADQSRRQTRWMWGVTPLKHRDSKSQPWRKLPGKPSVAMVGKTIYDGIMDLFFDNGDITDMDGAILAKINREGKGKNDTRYKVTADVNTLKKPMAIPSKLRAKIEEAMKVGGDCDLFKVIANMVKGPSEVKALLSGVEVESEDDEEWDDEGVDEGGIDDEEGDEGDIDDDEDEEDDEGDIDEDEDEDDEDGDEDGDDEDEDEEDDEDGDEDGDEDDEDDEDDEEDDDEEDEPEPPKSKAKSKAKPAVKAKAATKKAAAKKDDDEDDLGLDDLDEELTRISKGKSKKR